MCAHVCMCVSVCTHVYVCACVCMHVYACVSVCECVSVCMHMFILKSMHTHVCVCMHIHVCVCMHMSVCFSLCVHFPVCEWYLVSSSLTHHFIVRVKVSHETQNLLVCLDWWSANPRDLPASDSCCSCAGVTGSYHSHAGLLLWVPGTQTGPHACVTCTVLNELSPQH